MHFIPRMILQLQVVNELEIGTLFLQFLRSERVLDIVVHGQRLSQVPQSRGTIFRDLAGSAVDFCPAIRASANAIP